MLAFSQQLIPCLAENMNLARVCRNLNSWGCRVGCEIPDGMVTDVHMFGMQFGMQFGMHMSGMHMFGMQFGMHINVQGHRNTSVCKQTYDACCN